MKQFNYIYIITNNVNGKIYIGKHSTDNLNDGYMGSGKLIKKSIQKYGLENFTKEYLAFCDNEETLNYLERFYIRKYKAKELGYNLTDGGEGTLGIILSEESRKRKSLAKIGNKYGVGHKLTDEHKEKLSKIFKGKHLSEEHKYKLSIAHKGKHLSDEQKRRQSESLKGHKSWSLGKHWKHTKESIEHYRGPKKVYNWLTSTGEVISMSINHAKRYHPDWKLIENL